MTKVDVGISMPVHAILDSHDNENKLHFSVPFEWQIHRQGDVHNYNIQAIS